MKKNINGKRKRLEKPGQDRQEDIALRHVNTEPHERHREGGDRRYLAIYPISAGRGRREGGGGGGGGAGGGEKENEEIKKLQTEV